MKKQILVVVVILLLSATVFAGDVKAVKSGRVSFTNPPEFGSGWCSATFTKSASGVINQSDLSCTVAPQNPWANADVYFQFRPLDNNPNPGCDADGLVGSVPNWSTVDADLTRNYFLYGAKYNACAYLVNPVVGSGKIDVTTMDGTSSGVLPLGGKFKVCVTGTYDTNLSWADAKYLSWDNFATPGMDGNLGVDPLANPRHPAWDWSYLGTKFGEVQVSRSDDPNTSAPNWEFVDWGVYNTAHSYCRTMSATDKFKLRVYDADFNTGVVDWWWFDNAWISLRYNITYVGQ